MPSAQKSNTFSVCLLYSLSLTSIELSRETGQPALGLTAVTLSCAEIISNFIVGSFVYFCSGDQTEILMLAEQPLDPLNHIQSLSLGFI